ncbi:MAG: DUF1475 family protein [Opitutus sp.]
MRANRGDSRRRPMLIILRLLFAVILGSMLAVTSWATFQCPLFAVPPEVATHPWFVATLFDAYWGFITFYVWVAYKETSWIARCAWLVAILLLGNIAMAIYCLSELFHASLDRPLREILTTRHSAPGFLGLALAVIGIGVIGISLLS